MTQHLHKYEYEEEFRAPSKVSDEDMDPQYSLSESDSEESDNGVAHELEDIITDINISYKYCKVA